MQRLPLQLGKLNVMYFLHLSKLGTKEYLNLHLLFMGDCNNIVNTASGIRDLLENVHEIVGVNLFTIAVGITLRAQPPKVL